MHCLSVYSVRSQICHGYPSNVIHICFFDARVFEVPAVYQNKVKLEAKKIAATLESGQHKEGLLLNKRIKICQDASNLFERLESMTADELHKTVQPLMEESVDLPVAIMVRLVRRQCLEGMDSADPRAQFLDCWRPWSSASGVEEFCPLTPKLDAVIACVSDKYQTMDDVSEDEAAASRLDQEQQMDYKACFHFVFTQSNRMQSTTKMFKHIW